MTVPLEAAARDGSALRFAAVGLGAVAVNFLSYLLLLAVGLPTGPAKGAAFLLGAGFAFVVNGTFTFRSRLTAAALVRFTLVYAIGLALNVGLNAAVLMVLDLTWERLPAFLVATAASATWNYLGMRHFAFAERAASAPAERG
jgi:putative flippase GtrA